MSNWKDEFKAIGKEAPEVTKKIGDDKCSVCLVYRQGATNLEGRFHLDGSDIVVCDMCLNTILSMKYEHPKETEDQQWNWEPIKQRLGIK